MAFVRDWLKTLGYKKDPFIAEPSPNVNDYLVDRTAERERLNLFCIKQDRFGILHGPRGVGKSTLLRWLHEELKRESVLISGKVSHELFQDAFLQRGFGVFSRVTKTYEKLSSAERDELVLRRVGKARLVILIDDANELSSASKHLLRRLLERPHTQLILALERVLKEHEVFGEDRLGLELEPLSAAAREELLARRIRLAGGEGLFPFLAKDVKAIVAKKPLPAMLDFARERAIERSLHAADLREQRARQSKEPGSDEHGRVGEDGPAERHAQKRFVIRFVRRREGGITIGARRESNETKSEREQSPLRAGSADQEEIDAHLLNDIVAGSTTRGSIKREEKVTVSNGQTEIRDVIEELVEELGGKE